jgi:tRNA (guanine-N7-)-methyltransferase
MADRTITPPPASGSTVRRSSVTFKVRRRAMSPKRQALLGDWLARWGLDEAGPVLEWPTVFGTSSPVVLDIGFGHGESAARMARADPATSIVGIEIHTPGVATLLDAVDREGLDNVRVVHGDALLFLDRIAPASLHGVRIFFPDPWPKPRQHHRRIVHPDIVDVLVDRLEIGGTIHLATDVDAYAMAMQRVCAGEPRLTGGVVDRPDERPLTRFEQRGLDEGRHTVDMIYRRTHCTH